MSLHVARRERREELTSWQMSGIADFQMGIVEPGDLGSDHHRLNRMFLLLTKADGCCFFLSISFGDHSLDIYVICVYQYI